MTEGQLRIFRQIFPDVDRGEADYRSGRWSEIVGWRESFAYELGRRFAAEPPRIIPPGIVALTHEQQQMIDQLVRFIE